MTVFHDIYKIWQKFDNTATVIGLRIKNSLRFIDVLRQLKQMLEHCVDFKRVCLNFGFLVLLQTSHYFWTQLLAFDYNLLF